MRRRWLGALLWVVACGEEVGAQPGSAGSPCLPDGTCDTDLECVDEVCIDLTGVVVCSAGQVECPSGCTDLDLDPHNCGACGRECAAGEVCDGSGTCTPSCQAGLTDCGGICTDTDVDAFNCGGCDDGSGSNACSAGEVCDGTGVCMVSCQAGLTDCGGICTDTDVDSFNCGGCDDGSGSSVCPAGEVCDGAGACAVSCQEGLTECGGGCVNTDSDALHCGGCADADGQACDMDQACVQGVCAPLAFREGVAIDTGDFHTCVLSNDQAMRCWGGAGGPMAAYGQLGYGSTEGLGDDPGELPTPDVDVGGPVVQLSTGNHHTCALLYGGSVRCWGRNEFGQLGQGHTETIGDEPGEMPPLDTDVGGAVAQVVAGNGHTCALLTTGVVRCWGLNAFGRLGYGHTQTIGDEPGEMPPPDVDIGGNAVQLVLGVGHTCALLDDGRVRCWGANGVGQLGYGHTQSIGDQPGEMPPPDVDIGGTAVQLASGSHTCAILDDGALRCWGRNVAGGLGYGHTQSIGDEPGEMPPPSVDVGTDVLQVAVGSDFTCALVDGDRVRCWGHDSMGQLGYGHTNDLGDEPMEMPTPDVDLGGPAERIAAGNAHVCAVVAGEVRCWGWNWAGQLGYGDIADRGDEPGEMPPLDVPVF